MKIDCYLPFEHCPECENLELSTDHIEGINHSKNMNEAAEIVNVNFCRNGEICRNAYYIWIRGQKNDYSDIRPNLNT